MNEETRYTVEYMDGETLMKANLTQAELADLLKVPGVWLVSVNRSRRRGGNMKKGRVDHGKQCG